MTHAMTNIPSHWKVKKLKFLGILFSGLSDKKGVDFEKEYKEKFSKFIPFTSIANDIVVSKKYQYVLVKKMGKPKSSYRK